MSDYQLQSSKFYKKAEFSATGVLLPTTGHKLYGESRLNITIEGVTSTNQIEVQGKLAGATAWESIVSVYGASTVKNIDISNFDLIRFEVLTYSTSSGVPTIIASGHYSGGQSAVSVDDTLNNTAIVQGVTSTSIDISRFTGYSYFSTWTDTTPSAITFVDGDVDTGTEEITETSHGFLTGLKGQFTTTGTLPTGLSLATDYYVIKVDDDTFKVATSLANANAGTAVNITAAAGGGTHTFTPTGLAATMKLQGSLNNSDWVDILNSSVLINSSDSFLYNVYEVYYKHVRLVITQTAGQFTIVSDFYGKGL